MISYQNGNVSVELYEDGTKIREYSGDAKPEFPESIDVKITNYCNLSDYCQWCHEASDKNGKHGDLNYLWDTVSQLPAGVELAIGGGNPLSHPDLISFLNKCTSKGLICNITVNELHLKAYKSMLDYIIDAGLICGLGISYSGRSNLLEYFCKKTPNVVFHLIAGVNKLNDLEAISKFHNKVLVLGYKQFRKGILYHSEAVEANLYQWYIRLPLYFNKMTLSFDNLAIKQLNLKRYFTDKSWNEFFMGNDGEFTMYIDAVEQEYAMSSTSDKRHKLLSSIQEMFANIKK